MSSFRVRILVDNSAPLPTRLIAEYGFSALIEDLERGTKILFDTGSSGLALEYNMKQLGLDPRDIDFIVLSHRHYDHTGGLKRILELRGGDKITVISHPSLFKPSYARMKALGGILRDIGLPFNRGTLESLGARFLLSRAPVKITDNIIVSGEIPRKWGPSHAWGMLKLENGELVEDDMIDDIALYIKINNSILAIIGCGHSGIENIVEYGLQITNSEELYGIIGGLHLLGAPLDRVDEVIKYITIKKPRILGALHCTGSLVQGTLAQSLVDAYKYAGVGSIFEI